MNTADLAARYLAQGASPSMAALLAEIDSLTAAIKETSETLKEARINVTQSN